MERGDNNNSNSQFPVHRRLKDMFHPCLYHNHLYCEMSERKIKRLLYERDCYILAIECRYLSFNLTFAEHNWVVYLRDCCLFELHRRKFKIVLSDLIRFTHRNEYSSNRERQHVRLSSQYKVWIWLYSNEDEHQHGDYLRDIDEYPERLQSYVNNPQFIQWEPSYRPRSEDDMKCIEEGMQRLQITDSEDLDEEFPYIPEDTAEGKIVCVDNIEEAEKPSDMVEDSAMLALEPVTLPGHPSEQEPKLHEPETDIPKTYEQEYKKKSIVEHKEKEKARKDGKAYQDRLQEIEQKIINDRKKRLRSRKGHQALSSEFVKNAIRTALEHKGSPFIESPFAELATTSQDSRNVIPWTEITKAIDIMNEDVREKIPKDLPTTDVTFETSSAISSHTKSSSQDTAIEQVSTGKGESKYIQHGVYTVPTTKANIHIKKFGLTPFVLPEENIDIEGDYLGQLVLQQSTGIDGENTKIVHLTPPTVEEESEFSTTSQLSLIPSRKRPASYMDEDRNIYSLNDSQFESDPELIEDTNPPADFYATSPNSTSHNFPESTISESDLVSTRQETAPDFTDSQLPETPKEKKKK